MKRKKSSGIVVLLLVLLTVLAPSAIAASPSTFAPDAINWGRLIGYAECGLSVYIAVQSGGAFGVLAGVVCARVLLDPDN